MHKQIFAVVSSLLLVACGEHESSSRGFDYFPDMYTSPSYRSQQAMQIVLDAEGKPVDLPVMTDPADIVPPNGQVRHIPAMLTAPAGTVSRSFAPYPFAAMDFVGPHDLLNPLEPTADVLRLGQQRFHISCAPCHGNDGNAANGYVGHKFTGIPSLNGPNIGFLSDGDIYHIITMGRNRMPNYQAQLLPEQRWAVIHYVRLLGRAEQAAGSAEAAFKAAADALAKAPGDDNCKRDFTNATTAWEQAKRDLAFIRAGEATAASFVPKPEPKPEYVKPAWPEHP